MDEQLSIRIDAGVHARLRDECPYGISAYLRALVDRHTSELARAVEHLRRAGVSPAQAAHVVGLAPDLAGPLEEPADIAPLSARTAAAARVVAEAEKMGRRATS